MAPAGLEQLESLRMEIGATTASPAPATAGATAAPGGAGADSNAQQGGAGEGLFRAGWAAFGT
jgi:hypothetical protein